MAQGYTRQSAADIITGAVVQAAPLNAEFNALQSAFSETTGHNHSGTTGAGALVPLISDSDADTRIRVEATADEDLIRFQIAGTEGLVAETTTLRTSTGTTFDLGTSAVRFSKIWVSEIDATAATIRGAFTFATGSTVDFSAINITAATIQRLTNTTSATFSGTVTLSTGSTLDLSAITIASATFTSLTAGNLTVTSAVNASGAPATFANITSTTATVTNLVVGSTGTIGGVAIATENYVNSQIESNLALSTTTNTTATIATADGVPFVLADNLGISAGARLVITATADNWVFGEVASYTTATKTVSLDIERTEGSGTYAGWTVNIAGVQGVPLDQGNVAITGGAIGGVVFTSAIINSTVIGASAAAAGTFTNLTATSTATFADVNISGALVTSGATTLNGTLTANALADFQAGIREGVTTATVSTAYTVAAPGAYDLFLTTGVATTIDFSPVSAGDAWTLQVHPNTTTITWAAAVSWGTDNTAPTLTSSAAGIDVFTFVSFDGTKVRGFTAGQAFA